MPIFYSTDQITYTDTTVTPNVTTTSNAFSYGANVSDFGNGAQVAYASQSGTEVELGGDIVSSVALAAGDVLLQMCTDLTPKTDIDTFVLAGGTLIPVKVQSADGKIILSSGSIAAGVKVTLNPISFIWRDALIELTDTSTDAGDGSVSLNYTDAGDGTAWNVKVTDQYIVFEHIDLSTGNLLEEAYLGAGGIVMPVGKTIEGLNEIYVQNPNNSDATFGLDYLNDQARIVMTGTGVGNENGFVLVDGSGSVLFTIDASGNIIPKAGMTVNGDIKKPSGSVSLESTASFACLRSNGAGADAYIQANGVARIVAPFTTGTYKPIYASAFTVNSEKAVKTNIEKAAPALATVLAMNVVDYHLIDELAVIERDEKGKIIKNEAKDPAKVQKRKGLLLEEAPKEIVFGDGIDLYAQVSMLTKAFQEYVAKTDAKIAELEAKIK